MLKSIQKYFITVTIGKIGYLSYFRFKETVKKYYLLTRITQKRGHSDCDAF